MDSRVKSVNRAVREYDKYLFAQREMNGAIHIYRKQPDPANPFHLVFALTDTWTVTGRPVEWGLTVIEARLRALDLWKNETVVDRIEKELMDADESKAREFRNTTEAFLKDFRRQFARSTDSVNTASLAKIDRRRAYGA